MEAMQSILKRLKGRTKDRCLTSKQLCRLVEIDTGHKIYRADLRRYIHSIRCDALMAVGSCQGGYWEAQETAEVIEVIDRLNNRVANQLKAIGGLTDVLRAKDDQLKMSL